MSNPRRRQLQFLQQALENGTVALLALSAALVAAPYEMALTLAALGPAIMAAWRTRRALLRAARYGVGATSEAHVRAELKRLERAGWCVRHSLRCPGGDIDHYVISPNGLRAAIETKTRRWHSGHLRQAAAAATWASNRHCRAIAVLCVVRQRHLEVARAGVLIVSGDRLADALLRTATAASTGRVRCVAGDGYSSARC